MEEKIKNKILQRVSWIEEATNTIKIPYENSFGESRDINEIYECIEEIKEMLK
jgi:hypothetical protein